MARSFNGTTDLITLGTGFTPGGSFSLAAWSYIAVTPPGVPATIFGSTVNTNGIQFYATFNMALSLDRYGFGNYVTTANNTLSLNTWTHVGITYDGASAKAYINGALSNTGSIALAITGEPMFLGAVGSPATSFFNGRLADCGGWNVVLTAAEFAALANGARPYQIRSDIGYWPLDGLQSPEPDLSGNANNGTLTGTTLVAGPPMMMFTPRWPQSLIAAAAPPAQILFAQACL
jgi:hypothetical protein